MKSMIGNLIRFKASQIIYPNTNINQSRC